MLSVGKKYWEGVLDIIFPIECLGCGVNYEKLSPLERWLCEKCYQRLQFYSDDRVCPVCEHFSQGGKTHRKCQSETYLDGVWVSVYYDDLVQKMIHTLKFEFIEDLAIVLAKIMIASQKQASHWGEFQGLLQYHLGKVSEVDVYSSPRKNLQSGRETVMIPVPLHRKRFNWRGFNQSELLARYLAHEYCLSINTMVLQKNKSTQPQSQIEDMVGRKLNIQGAFQCLYVDQIEGKNIVLVDDICTTAATLDACAQVLKKNGARKVWGWVITRR